MLKFAEIAEPWIQRFEKYNVKPEAIYLQEKVMPDWQKWKGKLDTLLA